MGPAAPTHRRLTHRKRFIDLILGASHIWKKKDMNRNFIRINYAGGVEVKSSATTVITLDRILFLNKLKWTNQNKLYSVGTPDSYQLPQTTTLFRKRTVIQISLLKRISVIYGKRVFITMLTTANHWSVPWIRRIQHTPTQPFYDQF